MTIVDSLDDSSIIITLPVGTRTLDMQRDQLSGNSSREPTVLTYLINNIQVILIFVCNFKSQSTKIIGIYQGKLLIKLRVLILTVINTGMSQNYEDQRFCCQLLKLFQYW